MQCIQEMISSNLNSASQGEKSVTQKVFTMGFHKAQFWLPFCSTDTHMTSLKEKYAYTDDICIADTGSDFQRLEGNLIQEMGTLGTCLVSLRISLQCQK